MNGITEVQGWTAVDSFSANGYQITTPVAIAGGDGLTVEVRHVIDEVTEDSDTSAEFDAGIIFGWVGSSSSARIFDLSSDTALDRIHINAADAWTLYDTEVVTGQSAVILSNRVFTNLGIPSGHYDYGMGGTSFADWEPGQGAYDNFIDAVTDGNISCVCSQLGYNSANSGITVPQSTLQDFVDNIRSDLGLPSIPFLIIGTQRDAEGLTKDAEFIALWNNERNVANDTANTYNIWRHDSEISGDTIHVTQAAQDIVVERVARWFEFLLGESSYYRGPQITSAEFVGEDDSAVDINLGGQNTGFTDFTPTTDIAGYLITDDNGAATNSSVVRLDASTIRVTTTDTLVEPVTAEFAGYNGNVPGGLAFDDYPYGNDADTLPVEPLFASIEVTTVTSDTGAITSVMTGTITSSIT